MTSIGVIIDNTKKLHDIIDSVNDKTQNLAAATEEISASVSTILKTSNEIKEKLSDLSNGD